MLQIFISFLPLFLIISIILLNNILSYELSEEKIEILNQLINEQMQLARLKTFGLIVTTSKETLYKNIFGQNDTITTKSPFIIGSLTKSFTALSLLYLNISLNQTIDKFSLDDYIDKEKAKNITISELLNHTSGLDAWSPKIIGEKGNFYYSNFGFALLGKIIEKQSGQKYSEYIKEKIFLPLKMENSHAEFNKDIVNSYDNFLGFPTKFNGLESEIGDGFFVPAGFISSSIEDMGKYIQFYLNPENEEYISKLTEENIEVDYNLNYGMGIYIWHKNNKTIYEHDGETRSFLSDLFIFPELDMGFFLVTNTRDYFCQQPFYDFVNSIEAFLISDSFFYINDSAFFYTHFTIDLIVIIAILLPLIYLVITIIRKVKKIKYSWFIEVKGKIIFIIDVLLLVVAPIIIIICFYTVDSDLKYTTVTTRDIRFGIFSTLSFALLIFIVKLVYVFIYEKYFKKYDTKDKRVEDLSIDYMNVEE